MPYDNIIVSIIASAIQDEDVFVSDAEYGETEDSGPIEAEQSDTISLTDVISASAVIESIIQISLSVYDSLFVQGEDFMDLHVRKPDGCGGWYIATYRVKKRDYFP